MQRRGHDKEISKEMGEEREFKDRWREYKKGQDAPYLYEIGKKRKTESL